MSQSKSGKILVVAIVILFGGGALLSYPMVQWFRLEMAAREAIGDTKLGRFPDPAKLLTVLDGVKATGTKLGYSDLQVTIKLTERQVGPAIMWFFAVNIRSGSKEFETEKRVETEWQEDQLEILEEAGCKIVRHYNPDE